MKKLSILMALVLLLVAIVPVAAETPATTTTSMDEALIAHFDFTKLGKQGTALLRPMDASAHGVNEQLFHQETTIENGIATMAGGKTAYMSMNNYGDFASCTTGMTAFVAFCPEAVNDTWATIFSAGTSSAPVFRILLVNDSVVVQHKFGNNNTEKLTHTGIQANEWLWVAASVDYSANSTLTLTMHVSNDKGQTWNKYSMENIAAGTLPTSINALRIGRGLSGSALDNDYVIQYDDVQIWNRALTDAEIESITVEESTPTNVQVQARAGAEAGTYDIRICAAVDANALAYSALGFNIVVTDSEGKEVLTIDQPLTIVYTSVLAAGETVTAADLGGDYISALVITDIPESLGTLNFTISPTFECEGTIFPEASVAVTYPVQQ